MTTDKTPTDAEIAALYADETGFALGASHGQAPAGAGEAAEHYRNAIARACEGWTMPDGLRKHLETALWSPPTQQPAHAQAASSAVLKAIREANMQLVRTGDDAFMLVPYKAAEAQAAEPVARLVIGKTKGGVSLTHMVVPAAYQLQEGVYALYTAPQPVAREPLADEAVDLLCKVGPVYVLDGKVTRTPAQYRDELKAAQRYGLRKGEHAHGIKGGQHGTE